MLLCVCLSVVRHLGIGIHHAAHGSAHLWHKEHVASLIGLYKNNGAVFFVGKNLGRLND